MDHLQNAVSKTKKRIIPLMLILYILGFLDRSNIGYAKESYMLDLHLSEEVFALGAGIFFLLYALFGVPANLLMKKFGAKKWMFSIVFAWGMVSSYMGFANTETKFLVTRVLLGIAEAGFFPGMIYLSTLYFPLKNRASVMGLFYIGAPLAMVFGSPLSGALLELHGVLGYPGWFWMFVIEGGLAVLSAFVVLFYLDDSPQKSKFLNDEEKLALQEELDKEEQKKTSINLWDGFKNPTIWHCAIIYMLIQIGVYGYVFYLPTQVASIMGTKVNFISSLVTAIPWIAALIGTIYITRYSDKMGNRRTLAALILFVAFLGLIVSGLTSGVVAIFFLCLVAIGVIAVQPVYWTMPQSLLSGAALATGIGFINAFGAFGGFVAPLIRTKATQIFRDELAGLLTLGILVLIGVVLIVKLKYIEKEE